MFARVLTPLLNLAICLLLSNPLSTFAFPLDELLRAPRPVSRPEQWSQHLGWRERGGIHHYSRKKRTAYPTVPANLPGFPALVPTRSPKLPPWVNAFLDEPPTTPSITMQIPLASTGPSTSNRDSPSWLLGRHDAGISIQRPGNILLGQHQNSYPFRNKTPILNSAPNKHTPAEYEDPAIRRARMALGKVQGRKSPLGRASPLSNHHHEKRSPAGVPPSSAPAFSWMDKYAADFEELNPHAPRRPHHPPSIAMGRRPLPSFSGAGPSSPPGPSTPHSPRPPSKSPVGDPPPRIPTNPRRILGASVNSPADSPADSPPIPASAPPWVHNFHTHDITAPHPPLDPDPSHAYGPWKPASGGAGPSDDSGAGPSHGGPPRAGGLRRPPSLSRLKSSKDLAALAAAHEAAGPSRSYDAPGAGPAPGHPLRLPKSRSSANFSPGRLPPLHPTTNPLRSPMGRRPRVRKTAPAVVAPAETRVEGFEGSLGQLDLLMAKASLQDGGRGRVLDGQVRGGLTRELGQGAVGEWRVHGGLGQWGEGTVAGGQSVVGREAGGDRGEGERGGAQGLQSPSKRMREQGEDGEGDTAMRERARKVSPKGLGKMSPMGQ